MGVFPVTHDELVPPDRPGVGLQIEPEVGLLARLGRSDPASTAGRYVHVREDRAREFATIAAGRA